MAISWRSRMGMIMKKYMTFVFSLNLPWRLLGVLLGINPNNWFKSFSELIREGKLPTNCLIKIIGNNSKLDIPQNIASNVFQLDSVIHTEAIRMSLDVDTLVVIHPTGEKVCIRGNCLIIWLQTNLYWHFVIRRDVIAQLLNETKAGFTVDNADIDGIKK